MSNAFQTRPVVHILFSELGQIRTLHIEQLIVKCGSNIDIGAWCYLDRDRNSAIRNKGKKVDLTTFDKSRRRKLKSIIDSVFDEVSHLGEETQECYLRYVMNHLHWCDENGHSNVLTDQLSSRKAYGAYCDMLRDTCARSKLKVRTASKYQVHLLLVYKSLYKDSLFGDGVRLIKSNTTITNTTVAQDESEKAKVLGWCQAIFDGFTDFVLDENAFPFQLTIPKNNVWPIDHLWVFPTTKMVMTPDTLAIRHTLERGFWVYDYENGKLNTSEYVKDFYKRSSRGESSTSVAKNQIRAANKLVTLANSDLRHGQRKRLASIATLAFMQLLFAYSGQVSTPIKSMLWRNDYEISTKRQGFRIVKNRGHKGEILFELQHTFLPTFVKYLKLRDWLLKDSPKTELLFFSFGSTGKEPPSVWCDPTSSFKSNLKSIGIDLPTLGARQFRANRNEYANDHADLATASKASNHTIDTHKKYYMSGTQEKLATEMSGFFGAMVKSAAENQSLDKEIGFGHCESPGNPEPLPMQTKISPECGQPEGCLFCKKFLVHADEEDIRKLVSGRYVIQRTSHLADSPEHFDALFQPIFEQIAGLLNEIEIRDKNLKSMVKRVKKEVDEEEILSDFWASELRYLIDLELVHG